MLPCFRTAVSLGSTCAVRYQITRHLFYRMFPAASVTELHQIIFSPQSHDVHFGTHIFDWQITPFTAVSDYLEADFEGIFEREDLEPITDGNHVRNRRFGTSHPHAFTPVAGSVTGRQIDAEYAVARQKLDYLVEKFRQLLQSPGPILYLVYGHGDLPSPPQVDRLCRLLGGKSKDHRFHVAFAHIGMANEVPDFDGEQVSAVALSGGVSGKPVDYHWQGDDAEWEALLTRFQIAVPDTGKSGMP